MKTASSCSDSIDSLLRDTRNQLVEMYLGITVFCVTLAAAEQAALGGPLASLLEAIFHPAAALLLALLLLVHNGLQIHKEV